MPSFLSSDPAQIPNSDASISKTFRNAPVQPFIHRIDRELHAERSIGIDLVENGFGSRDQIGERNNLIDQAGAIGLLSVDDFAGENELQRPALCRSIAEGAAFRRRRA